MSEDIRKMIDKVKSFKQFVNEDLQNNENEFELKYEKWKFGGYSEGHFSWNLYKSGKLVCAISNDNNDNLPITTSKSTKVGNVDKHELGDLGISIRESLRVALIGRTFGHPIFADFFANQSNIITDTSMAKRGWLAELFVTSKKFTEKAASSYALPASNTPPTADSSKKVAGFFSGKK